MMFGEWACQAVRCIPLRPIIITLMRAERAQLSMSKEAYHAVITLSEGGRVVAVSPPAVGWCDDGICDGGTTRFASPTPICLFFAINHASPRRTTCVPVPCSLNAVSAGDMPEVLTYALYTTHGKGVVDGMAGGLSSAPRRRNDDVPVLSARWSVVVRSFRCGFSSPDMTRSLCFQQWSSLALLPMAYNDRR